MDPRLGNEFDPTEMKRVMLTASMCIHHIATMRPDMTRVCFLNQINLEPKQLHMACVSVLI